MKHYLRYLRNNDIKSPLVINEDIVRSVYRFELPACSVGGCPNTCKYLSSCLNGLLKIKISDDLICNEGETDPTVERIQVHSRNGLKNYGSTCYLNAFLQLYFRFKELRKTIYNVASQADETGIIHQLQLIFSQLQLSKSGVVDPGGLIEALRLCNTEQQDAPEFHCLFMNLLEARFQQVGVSVIDNLIRGEYIYETICSTCGFTSRLPSKFLELSLKVSSKSLPDCIKDYLKEEYLIGDNQYACPQCDCKRDGVRRAYITRAPPLLCIQLLRFTYDSKTGQRKKYKASIRLPDLLELTRVIDDKKTNKQSSSEHSVECLSTDSDPSYSAYRLCGVLLHIGNQPTSGHYIAVLRDSYNDISVSSDNHSKEQLSSGCEQEMKSDECWSVCNDADVFTIPSQHFKLAKVNGTAKSLQGYLTHSENSESQQTDQSKVDQSTENSSHRKAKKRRYDATTSSTDVNNTDLNESIEDTVIYETPSKKIPWHSSTNAYMLFYEAVDKCNIDQEIHVPSEILKTIEEVNLTEQEKLLSERKKQVNRKDQIINLISELKLPEPLEILSDELTVSLVSTSWLSDCLNHPLLFEDSTKSTYQSESEKKSLLKLQEHICPSSSSSQSSYSLRSCPHGRVSTDLAAGSYRAVSTAGFKKLVEILMSNSVNSDTSHSVKFDRFQPCKKCISLNIALLKIENAIKELSKELDYFSRTNHLSSSLQKRLEDEKCQDDAAGYYLIGKRSFRQWKTLARHYTRALYGDIEIDSDSQTMKPAQTTLNHDILCPHNQLSTENARCLPAVLWHQLVDLFPGANIPTFPIHIAYSADTVIDSSSILNNSESSCSECNAVQIDLTKRALCERQLLPGLFLSNSQRMRLLQSADGQIEMKGSTVNRSNELSLKESRNDMDSCVQNEDPDATISNDNKLNNSAIYLIPMDFVLQWRRFIKNPTAENLPSSLLSGLSTDGVLCEHNQMLKTWQVLIDESTLFPLSSYEWDVLSHAYPKTPQENTIPLNASGSETQLPFYPAMYLLPRDNCESKWQLEPSAYSTLCAECNSQLTIGNQTYNNARIRIRLVSGLDEAVSSCLQSVSINPPPPTTGPLVSLDAKIESGNTSIHSSESGNTNPDIPDQVGGTQTRVLTVDAKLVFAPHVILPATIFEHFMKMNNLKEIQSYLAKRGENNSTPLTSHNGNDLNKLSSSLNGSNNNNNSKFTQEDGNRHHILCNSNNNTNNIQSTNHLDSSSVNYVRRSTRQRLNPRDLLVKMNSSDTLLNMKVQLMDILGVLPSEQHIVSYGVELFDNTKTLQELGVCSNSILYVWADNPTWDPNRTYCDNLTFKSTTQKSKSGSPCKLTTEPIPTESGFKGTRLLEY
uniref:ubiquitinyl hydrolase 1 n=1 Tax=Trichobilharzia regenti TaxID=157069 RepID=A0AA85JPJ4_TRIRE|nr:unnamed protein product [Trichobilharzia regenti]